MLMQSAWERKDLRKIQKFVSSFMEGLEYLVEVENMVGIIGSGIVPGSDRDLDLIKFDSARLFQLAVGDVDEKTGHVSLPPSSSIAFLSRKQVFVGQIWRSMGKALARARRGEIASLRFFASYLLSKRGWPQLSELKRFETVRDHQEYLSREPLPVSEDLLGQVRKTCKNVFRNIVTEKLAPSRNASFASSRKQGGARSEVLRNAGLEETLEFAPDATVKEVVDAIRSRKVKLWRDLKFENIGRQASDFSARVQVIPEPGKFRIITAGDASLYTYLQPLQGSLLSNWQNCHHSTMNENWEEEVRGWYIPEGWVWNSGDYKAATDQLNWNTSMEAIDEIKKIYHLPDNFVSGFEGTEIQYSGKDVKRFSFGSERLPTSIWQRNGQLMGHPLSFPVLCVINLAALSTRH